MLHGAQANMRLHMFGALPLIDGPPDGFWHCLRSWTGGRCCRASACRASMSSEAEAASSRLRAQPWWDSSYRTATRCVRLVPRLTKDVGWVFEAYRTFVNYSGRDLPAEALGSASLQNGQNGQAVGMSALCRRSPAEWQR